ncbi:alpha/beta hydrolase [Halalkalibacter kiskunsagensis]|uniref:Alpha/beta hydrolase n=1 Tax=Halalkalibacter kiskunsagensis TaxID=1548599 RepID=A0ABV6KFZ6_9BACI
MKLWNENVPYAVGDDVEDVPTMVPYIVESNQLTGAIVVCPGGGYVRRATHEGEPIAKWLNSFGISAFVLNYRVHPYKHPAPVTDAKRAIRYVRKYAEKWNIDQTKVGILGFSAGGHLASTVGTQFDYGDNQSKDPIERESSRPDLLILSYPVITFGEHRHEGSMHHLLGENSSLELRNTYSSENQVSKDTPPTFIWHTADDESVPVENSLLFASALSKKSVPFELHTFENGRHGLGLAEDRPDVFAWTKLCESWINKRF